VGEERDRTFWLIVGEGTKTGDLTEVFELGTGGGTRAWPVFSFEEEALLFLRLGGLEGRWRVIETDAADTIPALTGACPAVEHVVLDPFPEVGFHRFLDVVSLHRKRFVELFAIPR
jgi:hypothetical protein